MRRAVSVIALVAGLAAPAWAAPKGYVLEAKGSWTSAADEAVRAAGGVVDFKHGATGLGVVRSENPGFLASAQASGAFASVTEDVLVQWQPDIRTYELDEASINPSDDTFFSNIQWAPQAVSAPAAWNAGCTGSGVRVAILDGGIYSAHSDLVANLDVASSRSFVPGFAFNEDTGTFWHGTHVAGIVAGADNTVGIVGIAPEATLIGVKVLHSGSGSFGSVISGILYASTPRAQGGAGADIINMSLGALFPKSSTGAGPLVAALNKAVNYAGSNGTLVVSAAGNSGLDLDHSGNLISVPAQSGAGIAVAATGPMAFAYGSTDFSRPASYTNYGNSAIHVSAPGGDFAYPGNENCTLTTTTGSLTRPCWVFDMVLSSSRGTGASTTTYSWAAGTSMAAPAASAVAAIIKQANPGISLGALKSALAQSADDVFKPGHDEFSGNGFVNAFRACTGQ